MLQRRSFKQISQRIGSAATVERTEPLKARYRRSLPSRLCVTKAMTDDQLHSALQAEYFQLQKVVEDMDGRVVTIKAWSVSFSLVAVAGAFASKAAGVLLLACVSAVLFWWIEARWKTFQDAYYGRIDELERHFRDEKALDSALQIRTSWYRCWKAGGRKRLWQILGWPHVALPHVVVAGLAIVLYMLVQLEVVRL